MIQVNPRDQTARKLRRQAGAYILAIALPALTLLIRNSLPESLGEQPLLILFTLPIAIAGLVGGLVPGLLTTLVTAILTMMFLVPPIGSLRISASEDLFQWSILVAVGLLASLVGQRWHRWKRHENEMMRYAAIVESSDDAIVGKDLQGRVRAWNPGAERMFGYTEQEALGQSLVQLIIPPELAAEESGILEKICQGQSVRHYETVRVRKDGTRVDVSVSVSPLRNTLGEIVGASKTARDITERKRAEAARLESEARLQFITDNAPVLLAEVDQERRYRFVNQRIAEFFESAPDAIIGKAVEEVIGEDAYRQAGPYITKVLSGQPVEYVLDDMDTPHGRRTMHVGYVPRFDASHRVVGFLAAITDITERINMERALAEREERFRLFMDHSPAITWIKDDQGRFIYLSRTFEQRFGVRLDDWKGKTDAELWPDEIAEQFRANDLEALRGAYPIEVVEKALQPDGRLSFWLTSKFAFYDTSGGRLVAGIAIDITERKQAEAQLLKLAQVVEQSPVSVTITNLDASIEYVNSAFTDKTGYTADEAIGKNPRMLKSARTSGAVFQDMWRSLATGHAWKGELWNRRKDGSEYRDSVQIVPIRQGDGTVTHYVGLQEDITEKKRLEDDLGQYRGRLEELVNERTAALEQAHRRLSETFDAMSRAGIAIFWIDSKTARLVDVNEHACEMTGYRREEMLCLTVPDMDPNCPLDNFEATVTRVREERRAAFEATLKHREGHLIPVEVTLYFSEAAFKDSGVHLAFITDISRRKQAEQALIEAKQMAESANRAKSAFLANMSHEIRTPLNAITGMAHLIRKAGLKPEQAERLDKLEDASDHLLKVLSDILDLSKIEAGKLVLEEVPVDIPDVVANVVAMLSGKAQEKHLALDSVIEPTLSGLELLGDKTRLQQALLNYVNNAIKFTERGRISIRTCILDEGEASALILFEVSDTGIGIAPGGMSSLFGEFQQADNSITRKYGGTGLGLAITKRLAGLMGGEVGIDTRVGAGSSFWFTARLKKGSGTELQKDDTPLENPETVLKRDYPGTRILLAEDDPINREVARSLLEEFPFVVDEAEDGLQALEQASRNPYDLILMDLQMPRMGGLEATEQIRLLPRHATTPIVAMTANAFKEDEEKCLAAGMNGFISKPVPPEELYATLLRFLKASSDRRRLANSQTATCSSHKAAIGQAIQLHQLWVARFQSAIEGINVQGFDVGSAGDFTQCGFGQWLDNSSTRDLLGESVHAQIDALHRHFHKLAGKLSDRLNQGEAGASVQQLFADVENASRQLVLRLKAIQLQAGSEADD